MTARKRHTVSARVKSIIDAILTLNDAQIARLVKGGWRFAEIEQKRRRSEERKRKRAGT